MRDLSTLLLASWLTLPAAPLYAMGWVTVEQVVLQEDRGIYTRYTRGWPDTEASFEDIEWIDCKKQEYAAFNVMHWIYDDTKKQVIAQEELPRRTLGDAIDTARREEGGLAFAKVAQLAGEMGAAPRSDETPVELEPLVQFCAAMDLQSLGAAAPGQWVLR